ncbi:MAG: hypothetical protein HY231_14335 [Acidobacteria bacterium]|nr:hypothetical protein [Acidobacteriota bacterium]
MKNRWIAQVFWALAFVALSVNGFLPPWLQASSAPTVTALKEVYTGNLIYIGGSHGVISTTFTLTIDSYTPDSEVVRLTNALKSGGQDALLKAIGNEKRGTIQVNSSLGQDINAVWISTDGEGERKITALSKRWIGTFEARRGTRSLDYPFTYIEVFMDDKGKGDGGMIPAAKVRAIGDKTVEVENFGIYPARLLNITRRNG